MYKERIRCVFRTKSLIGNENFKVDSLFSGKSVKRINIVTPCIYGWTDPYNRVKWCSSHHI